MIEPGVSSSPAARKSRPKLRRYLMMSVILFGFTALGDLALRLRDPELQERLRAFGKAMSESIEALDPFVMARAFYNRLLQSEYSLKLVDWAAPFNLTEARIRFRELHPACPNPDPRAIQLDPRLGEYLQRQTSTLGTGNLGPGQVGSGSMSSALLLGTPAPTPLSESLKPYGSTAATSLGAGLPTPNRPELSQSTTQTLRLFGMETPTPVVSTGLSGFLNATPIVGLSGILATPTPDIVEEWLRRRAISTESNSLPGAGLAGVATPTPFIFSTSLRDSMQAAMPPPCSPEEAALAAELRENSLKGVGLAQIAIGLPDALIHTGREVRRSLDAGWASAIPVLLVLICAVALVGPLAKAHPLALLSLPVAAGVIVWVLLLPIRLAAYLFPTALGAVELVAFVAAIPPVLWMVQVAFAVAQTAAIETALDKETGQKSS